MKVAYKEINFRRASRELIDQVNAIIREYQDMGYSLTLRQVYYQLVSRDVIPNKERSYKNLGNTISEARMAGLISWTAIEDRTRYLRSNSHWSSPASIIRSAASSFAYDKWSDQENYVEVWVEKDALIGVVAHICEELDVPHFSCRGYVSQSEMWTAGQRLKEQEDRDRQTVILHLGDHDPSGKDMSRDILERLETFGTSPIFRRLALNMDQIDQYNPPPNPTKVEDSRAKGYIEAYGYDCWELDALRPDVIGALIRSHVMDYCDLDKLAQARAREEKARDLLYRVSDNWGRIERDYR